jgi:hypothetical protein
MSDLLGLVADHDALVTSEGQPAITISAPDILVLLDCNKGNNFTAKGVVGTSFSWVFS